jgi:hypothetical protein
MGVVRHTSKILVRNPEGMSLLERPRTVKKILKAVGCRLDCADSGYCPVEGCCEYDNEAVGSLEDDTFFNS